MFNNITLYYILTRQNNKINTFITKLTKIHKDIYEYSKVEYINNKIFKYIYLYLRNKNCFINYFNIIKLYE